MKSSRDNQRKLFTNSWDHPWAVSVWIRPQTDTEIRTGRQATTTQVPDCVYVGGRGEGHRAQQKALEAGHRKHHRRDSGNLQLNPKINCLLQQLSAFPMG